MIHRPVLPLGATFVIVDGPVAGSGYWWYEVTNLSVALDGGVRTGWVASADRDGTAWIGPASDACERFPFAPGPVSVETFGDLERGFVGRWSGCVTTPWIRPYWVDVEFRVDGSYSAVAGPSLNDPGYPAFYYGMDGDSPLKRYELDTLRDDLEGSGWIDIVFDVGSVNRDELRNVRLMGDDLEFEFFHGAYGPVVFRLYRIAT